MADSARAPAVAVDVSLHRRAAEVLEEGRDRVGSPWFDARLSSEVVALYRPGLRGPAYYEFGVQRPDGAPAGFLILSSGAHDAPLVQASMHGERPSAQLVAMAGTDVPARLYRLGYTFVAEDARGRLVAQLGDLPGKLVGYDPAWLEVDSAKRRGRAHYDGHGEYRAHEPGVGQSIALQSWSSWQELRRGYGENWAPLHARDAAGAVDDWEVERQLADNGETLQSGQFRELPLLERGGASFEVRGDGASFVQVVQTERPIEGDQALRVFVHDVPGTDVWPVDIDVRYADGSSETLRLGVMARDSGAYDEVVDPLLPSDVLGAPVRARRPGDPPLPPGASGATVTIRIRPLAMSGLDCSKVALRTQSDKFVSRDGTNVRVDAKWVGNDELFAIDHMGGGRVNFRASNGKWLRAAGGGGGAITADQDIGPAAQSIFRIFGRRGLSGGWYGFQAPDRKHFVIGRGDMLKADESRSTGSALELAWCEPTRLQSHWAGSNFEDVWRKVRKYDQLPAHEAPSTSQCSSGCGATAWAMLFGFHDFEASLGMARWRKHWGLYRKDGSKSGPDEVAPEWFWADGRGGTPNAGIANVVWEISQQMNDWTLAGCAPNGEKWTAPVIMGRAHKYVEDRTDGVALGSDYDGAMIFTHEGKTKVRDILKGRQPVVIGTRDPHHYPLAIGWESTKYKVWIRDQQKWSDNSQREHFVVHMGHQQDHPNMVPYDSWFAGWLRVPNVADDTPATAKPSEKPNPNSGEPAPTYIPPPKLPTPKTKPLPKPQGPGVGPAPTPIWK